LLSLSALIISSTVHSSSMASSPSPRERIDAILDAEDLSPRKKQRMMTEFHGLYDAQHNRHVHEMNELKASTAQTKQPLDQMVEIVDNREAWLAFRTTTLFELAYNLDQDESSASAQLVGESFGTILGDPSNNRILECLAKKLGKTDMADLHAVFDLIKNEIYRYNRALHPHVKSAQDMVVWLQQALRAACESQSLHSGNRIVQGLQSMIANGKFISRLLECHNQMKQSNGAVSINDCGKKSPLNYLTRRSAISKGKTKGEEGSQKERGTKIGFQRCSRRCRLRCME
jgi:hypothetical protein